MSVEDIPVGILLACLILFIFISGLFSAAETGLMSLNRYRLKHLAKTRLLGARHAYELLQRPDRLIGLILLGQNFFNIVTSSLTTLVALKLWGDTGLAIATGVLTILLLIFADVAPKTIAALYPERIAFPAALVLKPLLKALYPVVWGVNALANSVLRLMGISIKDAAAQPLTQEELRTVVNEAGALIPQRHQKMLLSILDLEKVTVEDIMIPRNEIVGIDLDEDIDAITRLLSLVQHTRLPVYRGDVNQVIGILHVRNAIHLMLRNELTKEALQSLARECYFVPEGTPLNTQLINFQRQRRRIGLVVDEYGEVLGLITLEDILEEIVGEFTTAPANMTKGLHPQPDGSYLVDGTIHVRQINRMLNWKLPTDGPKTLNGLIIEYLETIPEPGTSVLLAGHPVEIIQIKDNAIKTARIYPPLPAREKREAGQ